MQAIITKVLPATNTKPTRIKASCERGSLIASYNSEGMEKAHKLAALSLCRSFIMEDEKRHGAGSVRSNPWGRPFVSGQLENGDWAHVETGDKTKHDGLLEAANTLRNQLESLADFVSRNPGVPFIDPRRSDRFNQAVAVINSAS